MQTVYRTTVDPGLHAAAEWLLRQWQEETWLSEIDEAWAKDVKQREKRGDAIRQQLTRDKGKASPQWYIKGQGQTMVVIPGPMEFLMGSPPTEMARMAYERLHAVRITRTFAIAAKPVTLKQYLQFRKEHFYIEDLAPNED